MLENAEMYAGIYTIYPLFSLILAKLEKHMTVVKKFSSKKFREYPYSHSWVLTCVVNGWSEQSSTCFAMM
jgi:hypothetical protein